MRRTVPSMSSAGGASAPGGTGSPRVSGTVSNSAAAPLTSPIIPQSILQARRRLTVTAETLPSSRDLAPESPAARPLGNAAGSGLPSVPRRGPAEAASETPTRAGGSGISPFSPNAPSSNSLARPVRVARNGSMAVGLAPAGGLPTAASASAQAPSPAAPRRIGSNNGLPTLPPSSSAPVPFGAAGAPAAARPAAAAVWTSTTTGPLLSAQCQATFEVDGVRVRFAALSQPGCEGPGMPPKANQDTYVIHERLQVPPPPAGAPAAVRAAAAAAAPLEVALLGVMDGHGQHGRPVSHHVAGCLPVALASAASMAAGDAEEACRMAFPEANRSLITRPDLDGCPMSGCTCCTALLLPGRKLVVGNVGDSLAILGSVDARGQATARVLNIEHAPTIAAEAERIINAGGRIEPYRNEDGEFEGAPRVWLKTQDVPGLAMTRAFGDGLAARVGVVCEPTCTTTALRPPDKYLVVCSDGISEFIDGPEIIKLVHGNVGPNKGPREACQLLMTEARRRWAREEGAVDDCTVIVAYLTVPA